MKTRLPNPLPDVLLHFSSPGAPAQMKFKEVDVHYIWGSSNETLLGEDQRDWCKEHKDYFGEGM